MAKPSTTESVGSDDLFKEAVKIVVQYDRASTSLLQRRLIIGYKRAARLMDQLEKAGVVCPQEGAKPREVLVNSYEEWKSGKKLIPSRSKDMYSEILDIKMRLERLEEILSSFPQSHTSITSFPFKEDSEYLKKAVREVTKYKKISASLLHRPLSIGYARACRLLDHLESKQIISPHIKSGYRKVLISDVQKAMKKLISE